MSRARVVLADDHSIVLEGMRRILETYFELVGMAHDGRELVEQVRALKPEVAVADISMPVLNGLDAFRQCQAARLSTRFVFLTANPDIALATQAFQLGASGYVLKQAASEELVTAIREALHGRTYITPRIAGGVRQNLMAGGSSAVGPELTLREREVLQLLAEGRTLKEAAAVLGVSPRTIEFHKNNIAEKTGLKTMAELARYAARHGLVSDSI
jgi:DNA-binding NarL/FixJ family response regulator